MNWKNAAVWFIVALLLAWGVWSTHSWHECREEKKDMLVSVYLGDYNALLALGDAGGLLEYQLQNNGSETIVSFYIRNFRDNAWAVENAFWILYEYSNDKRFWKIHTAVVELSEFPNTVLNRPPEERIEKIRENIETLKKFDTLFKGLSKHRDPFDIPDELADEFLKTSEQLKW